MARPVSQDIIDLVRVVYARYGVGSFGFAGIKDLVPSHQYLSLLNNEGWITKCRPWTRKRPTQWQLTPAAIYQARRENSAEVVA